MAARSGNAGPSEGEPARGEDRNVRDVHGVLSAREVEILRAISAGHTTREISAQLKISSKTVDNHKQRIFAKLGVQNAAHAVAAVARAAGPLAPDVAHGSHLLPAPELSHREHQILEAIDRGLSIKQTALALGLASKTVENLQSRLFSKLEVRNRAQAVYRAHQLGLLPDHASGTGAADGE
jgi:DNA-binding NarL/FixJ family response regulator